MTKPNLTETEHDLVTCLVHYQATRSAGYVQGSVPPSTYKRALAQHFKPAQLEWTIAGLTAQGLVAPHAVTPGAYFLTKDGVQYACQKQLVSWEYEHLLGESDGPYIYFEELQQEMPPCETERRALQHRIQANIARVLLEWEREFLTWAKSAWRTPEFMTT